MADNSNYLEEIKYLNEIIGLLKSMLESEREQLESRKTDLIQSRREMWENTTHTSADFEKLTD
ncbi:MAG TPA: hypothetical protein PLF27_11480, partial [Sedimentibacter sp.]|nr:hypothetical protein [Sedimentibacter sp.]